MLIVLVLLPRVEFEKGYAVVDGAVVLFSQSVEFDRGYTVVNGLVVLPSWSVTGKTPYPDP